MESQKNVVVEHTLIGTLKGHGDYVTSIVTGLSKDGDKESEVVVSGSRDKKLMIWRINEDGTDESGDFVGEPYISLTGHNHFVSDIALSQDGTFVLSSSWDKSMRLWSLKTGKCTQKFFGDKKELTSCAFSNDSRQLFSCGFNKKLTLWNTKGELKAQSNVSDHKDCVTRIRFSPSQKNQYYASVGWDKRLKIWNQFFRIQVSIKAHDDPINALAINANGIYIATGCKGHQVKIWKL